jgi:hypothetical protein
MQYRIEAYRPQNRGPSAALFVGRRGYFFLRALRGIDFYNVGHNQWKLDFGDSEDARTFAALYLPAYAVETKAGDLDAAETKAARIKRSTVRQLEQAAAHRTSDTGPHLP